MQKFFQQLARFLGSYTFFMLTLVLFVASSTWIALSARYPMAFDEGYHLGLIKLHAHSLLPFFIHQPSGPATYGALTRDPSYLYHYLMSFPYFIVSHLTGNLMVQVITLRFMNIVFFAIGLALIRKILLKTHISPWAVNMTVLFITLTPVVPLLAGQINYDNLIVLLTAWTMLLAIQFVEKLKAKKLDVALLAVLISVSLLACEVKFTFLPVLTAIVAYLLYELVRQAKKLRLNYLKLGRKSWLALPRNRQVALGALLALSAGFFLYTYGINLVQYHNPIPQCGQVLGIQRCQAYAPWARNYADALYDTGVDANPLRFTASWFYGMFNRLFFTINGPDNPASNDNHLAPVASVTAVVVALFGLSLFMRYSRPMLKQYPLLGFLLFAMLVYCGSVWGRNYHDFLHLGKMVAINGRYLVPLLFPLYAAIALGYQQFLAHRVVAKGVLLVLVLLLFLEGGGITGFLYYSNDNWYWPHGSFARRANLRLHDAVKLIFIAR